MSAIPGGSAVARGSEPRGVCVLRLLTSRGTAPHFRPRAWSVSRARELPSSRAELNIAAGPVATLTWAVTP
jgi:hypothetical protein